jgi:ADP-dependent NAD(P)H-hydrate dehydratase / NAD(P)H-hydrate epimerase
MSTIKKLTKLLLQKRKPKMHKGDFGRVLVLAGSQGMSGACVLTSMAALRSGAGLVTVGVPKSLVLPLAKRFTEAMMLPLSETKIGSLSSKAYSKILKSLSRQTVLAIGPGLSTHPETQALIRKVVLKGKKPVVIDADGLSAFKGRNELIKKIKSDVVLTPHEGEFMRLFGGKRPRTDAERKKRAREVASLFGVTLVLKGHRTVVAASKGRSYVNLTGNSGMATGGSGDVLTGVIAAFLGQGLDPFEAACLGVYIHGLSGDIAAKAKGKISLIASDILNSIPAAFKKGVKS